MFGETFGAITALKQKRFTFGHPRQFSAQTAGLTCKNERGIGGKPCLDILNGLGVGIGRNLQDRLGTPGTWAPIGQRAGRQFRHWHNTLSQKPFGLTG